MVRRIIVPNYEPVDQPLIFLAGPIQGARDWQAEAFAIFDGLDIDAVVASPRSPPPWHGNYDAQVRWEHDHLALATDNGVILFWLAEEAVHDCHRAFAQTTRFELGWSLMRHVYEGAQIAIGIECGFSNARYLRFALGRLTPHLPIYDTLEDTCRGASLLIGF